MGVTTRPGMADNRLLPERANLEFHYPDKTIVIIPFYENPKISERGQASYAEYNPVNRGGSMYAYTGAKSRSFKIEATYTLPHITNFPMGISKFLRMAGTNPSAQKALFFSNTNQAQTAGPSTHQTSLAFEARKIYWQHRLDQQSPEELASSVALQTMGIPSTATFVNQLAPTEMDKTIDSLLFFLAVFRTSILNNARNPIQGPPIVRINFGATYDSIPCIVKNYNIAWEEAGGYDIETLMPRIFKISIDLNEVRMGDFSTFERNTAIKRDNLAGWEAVLGTVPGNTIAPGGIK
jgi:hypothetical protein